jgi:hypothetical protein
MNKIKIIIVFLVIIFIFSVIYSERNVFVTFTNNTDRENIKVSLYFEDSLAYKTNLKNNLFISDYFNTYSSMGLKKVKIICEEFNLEKEIRILSIFNNYIDFDISSDYDNSNIIIIRKSWFPLKYE